MARGKKPLIENVEIKKIAAEGKSIAYIDDKVLFVPNTVPGDIVDVQVTRKRKNFMEGYVTLVRRLSSLRVEPFCGHFGVCGGCKWQNLPYSMQLEVKQQEVIDNLRRIGKVELPPVSPIIGSPRVTEYRNKLEYTFSNRRYLSRDEIASSGELDASPAVGFHVPGLFDKVVAIDRCHLQPSPSNEVRDFIRDHALRHGLSFYDIRTHTGFLRTLIVRTASTGEVMVILSLGEDRPDKRDELLGALVNRFPEITSLFYVLNEKLNDTITDRETVLFHGRDHIIERMEDLQFKIGPKSFYQTNSEQAYNLYARVRELAALTGTETVYDLYTGTGTIANFLARRAARVVGIEYVPEAIDDARANSALNGIGNTAFFAGDMKDVLSDDFITAHGHPDVVITDPPRAGMHPDVVATILRTAPSRVVYVSCNPATQARDLALMDSAYRVAAVQPVDMFPHTHHVENIVLLQRRN